MLHQSVKLSHMVILIEIESLLFLETKKNPCGYQLGLGYFMLQKLLGFVPLYFFFFIFFFFTVFSKRKCTFVEKRLLIFTTAVSSVSYLSTDINSNSGPVKLHPGTKANVPASYDDQ